MPILPLLNSTVKFAHLSVCVLLGTRHSLHISLNVSNTILTPSPVSALSVCALLGTRPSLHISLNVSSTSLTPSPVSASSFPLAGSIFEPAATIIGDVAKMLQPGQAPEK